METTFAASPSFGFSGFLLGVSEDFGALAGRLGFGAGAAPADWASPFLLASRTIGVGFAGAGSAASRGSSLKPNGTEGR